MIPGFYAAGAMGQGGSGDPHWANVVSLLHFDGTNGSTTFTDQKGKTWTSAGGAQISTTDPKFGSGCLLLDGTDDYVSVVNDSSFDFGTGDLCIEAFVNIASSGTEKTIFSARSGSTGITFRVTSAGEVRFFYGNGSGSITSSGAGISVGTYKHVAMDRSSGTVRLFAGGVLVGSGTVTVSLTSSKGESLIGRHGALSADFFAGRIDDFRITRASRYTSSFTPPTAPFPDS